MSGLNGSDKKSLHKSALTGISGGTSSKSDDKRSSSGDSSLIPTSATAGEKRTAADMNLLPQGTAATVGSSSAAAAASSRGHEDAESEATATESTSLSKRPRFQDQTSGGDLSQLPTRQYLDRTVVPLLMDALAALAKERPPDPVDYLTSYLNKHKHDFANTKES